MDVKLKCWIIFEIENRVPSNHPDTRCKIQDVRPPTRPGGTTDHADGRRYRTPPVPDTRCWILDPPPTRLGPLGFAVASPPGSRFRRAAHFIEERQVPFFALLESTGRSEANVGANKAKGGSSYSMAHPRSDGHSWASDADAGAGKETGTGVSPCPHGIDWKRR